MFDRVRGELKFNIAPENIVEQVTVKVDGRNVVLDYIAMDDLGNFHLGGAKYGWQ